ncbi:MAG: hypothetical protein IJ731_09895 [Eubacterium sp.]|nr:hypothetical protein [Eubacterium sp.]
MFGKGKKSKVFNKEKSDVIREEKNNAAQVHEEFYNKVRNAYRSDELYELPDDEELTPEEIKKIHEFWDKYSFAYPDIDFKSFKAFKNRRGKVEVRHLPSVVRTMYLQEKFAPWDFRMALQVKAMLPLLFSNAKQPRTVLRQMNGFYTDSDFNLISRQEATQLLAKESAQHRMIVKPRTKGGGRGIFFIEKGASYEKVEEAIDYLGPVGFVIQETLEQSEFMKKFNPSSVNTLRITSFLWKDEVHILASLIRVGKKGNEVDNYSQGGSLIGLDAKTGKCCRWAFTHEHERITVLPSGLDLNQDLYVPNYEKAVSMVKEMHSRIPYIRMVSWDIAIDCENEPVFIENNFAGMIQIHECVTGPLFGDLTEEVLDEYLIKRFCFSVKVDGWLVDEYNNHVVIKEYIEENKEVVVPEKLLGKRVKSIKKNAFAIKDISSVSVSQRLYDASPNAFEGLKIKGLSHGSEAAKIVIREKYLSNK